MKQMMDGESSELGWADQEPALTHGRRLASIPHPELDDAGPDWAAVPAGPAATWRDHEPRPLQAKLARGARVIQARGWEERPSREERRAAQFKRSGRVEGAPAIPSGGGRSLPEPIQARMESALGADFSDVRVHEGPHVDALGAEAYTQGSDIHFAPGRLNTGSTSGQRLLGHELAHVVQQREGRVAADSTIGGLDANTSPSLEQEADALGDRAASHSEASPELSTAGPALGGGAATGSGAPVQRKARRSASASAPIQAKLNSDGKKKKDGERKAHTPELVSFKHVESIYGSPSKGKGQKKKVSGGGGKKQDLGGGGGKLDTGGGGGKLDSDGGGGKLDTKGDDDQRQDIGGGGEQEEEQLKPEKGRGLELLTQGLTGQVKDAVDAQLEAQRKAALEAERLKLDREVNEGIHALECLVADTEDDLSLGGLKGAILKPVLTEKVFPEVSSRLFTKEQGIVAKQIAKERGTELEAAYQKEVDANHEEAQKAQGDGSAGAQWKAIKAKKATEGGKHKAKAKDQMAAEIARQSVEDQLLGRADELTERAWNAVGGANWLALVTQSMGGQTFPLIRGRVGRLIPAAEDLESLKAAKERVTQETASVHTLLVDVRGKTQKAFEATATKNISKIEDAMKKGLNLSWRKSGSEEDRAAINSRAKDQAAKRDVQMKVAGGVAKASLESSLSGFSGSLGGKLDAQVPNQGDFVDLEVQLKIPVGAGVSIVLLFNGELERDDEGVSVKLNGQLGASFGLEGLFTVQATFGGYIEAKGVNAAHALELMSYSFYQRAQGKLPSSWYDKIWGVGGTVLAGKEAQTWSAYVEEKMKAGHYVESGLMAEVGVEIGNDQLGAEAKLSGQTGTRWSKGEEGEGIVKDGILGGTVSLGMHAEALGLEGTVDFGVKRIRGKATEVSVAGEATLNKGKLGTVGGKVLDTVKGLMLAANAKLATRLAKDPEAKKALKASEEDASFGKLFLGTFQGEVEGLRDGAIDVKREQLVGPSEEQASDTFAGLQGLDDGYDDVQGKGSAAVASLTDKADGVMKPAFQAEKAVNDAKDSAKEALGIKDESADSISIGFEFSYSTVDGWSGDLYFKETATQSVDVGGYLSAEMNKGHKYSIKNNALSQARKADKKAAEDRQAASRDRR